MNIAILMTCHNRCKQTVACVQSLNTALDRYNKKGVNIIFPEIYLTDDGCTDGTAESVRNILPDKKTLHVLKGDGNLFWAGGMRYCWREAMKSHTVWDYYLLLNDDTILSENAFDELFNAEKYAVDKFGKKGIVSGITCDKEDPTKLTYGGDVWVNRFLAKSQGVKPNGEPQMCDLTNANILLVPSDVVDRIGIFYEGYQHGLADYDYSNTARKAGIPVVLTAGYAGRCNRDHLNVQEFAAKIMSMKLSERKKYFKNPKHSSSDYLRFIWRVAPFRVPIVWLGRILNVYFPKLYYRMSNKRRSM